MASNKDENSSEKLKQEQRIQAAKKHINDTASEVGTLTDNFLSQNNPDLYQIYVDEKSALDKKFATACSVLVALGVQPHIQQAAYESHGRRAKQHYQTLLAEKPAAVPVSQHSAARSQSPALTTDEPEPSRKASVTTEAPFVKKLSEKLSVKLSEDECKQVLNTIKELMTPLMKQVQSAHSRGSDDDRFFLDFVKQSLNGAQDRLVRKLTLQTATFNDVRDYQNICIKTIDDSAETINAHRGSSAWRLVMDSLAALETWCKQKLFTDPSLAAKDTFFSTKTAKTTENFVENVRELGKPKSS